MDSAKPILAYFNAIINNNFFTSEDIKLYKMLLEPVVPNCDYCRQTRAYDNST